MEPDKLAGMNYIVIVNSNGFAPYIYDTETKTKIMSYPTTAEAERQAKLLNRFIYPGEHRVGRVAVGELAEDADAYFDAFIECDDCGGTGSFETSHPGPNNYGESCDTCDGTGLLRAPDDE